MKAREKRRSDSDILEVITCPVSIDTAGLIRKALVCVSAESSLSLFSSTKSLLEGGADGEEETEARLWAQWMAGVYNVGPRAPGAPLPPHHSAKLSFNYIRWNLKTLASLTCFNTSKNNDNLCLKRRVNE